MRRSSCHQTLPFIMALLAGTAAAQNITPGERQQAAKYLDDSRDGVVQAVQGLSDAQWKFTPGPTRWSIAEVVEHLALIENFFLDDVCPELFKSPKSSPSAGGAKDTDRLILSKLSDRSTKYQAPDLAVPTGRWTPQEALRRFLAAREQTVGFLNTATDLRLHSVSHPAFGPLDGYQWVLAVAAHSARHTQQILEVKAAPNFPAN
jgi:uncharacterized damage-inducible protein DinB